MVSKKRAKGKAGGTREARTKRARPGRAGSDLAGTFWSAVDELFDELDTLAESVASGLGLRESRRPAKGRKA